MICKVSAVHMSIFRKLWCFSESQGVLLLIKIDKANAQYCSLLIHFYVFPSPSSSVWNSFLCCFLEAFPIHLVHINIFGCLHTHRQENNFCTCSNFSFTLSAASSLSTLLWSDGFCTVRWILMLCSKEMNVHTERHSWEALKNRWMERNTKVEWGMGRKELHSLSLCVLWRYITLFLLLLFVSGCLCYDSSRNHCNFCRCLPFCVQLSSPATGGNTLFAQKNVKSIFLHVSNSIVSHIFFTRSSLIKNLLDSPNFDGKFHGAKKINTRVNHMSEMKAKKR